MSTWSPVREALANIEDGQRQLIQAVVASAGGSPGRVTPSLRPQTAVDRLRRRQRINAHGDLMTRLGVSNR